MLRQVHFIPLILFSLSLIACQNQPYQAIASNSHAQQMMIGDYQVIDGDTIVIEQKNKKIRIRLDGIDAPEMDQAFGDASRLWLQQCLTSAKPISVSWQRTDKYGRLLGTLYAGSTDCNLRQIKHGFAWHYKFYQDQQTPQARLAYSQAHQQARQQKLGLWQQHCPINPWAWRQKQFDACEL